MDFGHFLVSFPQDSGPIYQETLQGRLPVEPFNTYSNILFLLIIIYFSVKVYPQARKQAFLAWCLPILFLGYVGGTVYHATRSHDFWMYLDWLPIIILCFAVSVYFIAKLRTSGQRRALLIGIVLLLVVGNRLLPWPVSLQTSAGYIGTALGLLLPLFVYMYTEHMRHWNMVALAVFCFCLAISFRIMDRFVYILPMGSHWLWHCFGALSVFFMMNYIFLDREREIRQKQINAELH
ncbi:MAG: hypothetical protein VX712_04205 [Bacteroidota bacterium]|uniref:hypothetical protein n=1 Tax=Christiangramia sp. TaxID=1931228 RepID=UPI000C57F0CE|nr:hypothetical protein [Christiangramia sp.]MEE2771396.1 hypothetical protein [Bacteroidota bacterium]